MNRAQQHWAQAGIAAARDGGLSPLLAGGALLIWDPASGRAGFADASGLALLGRHGLDARLPAPTRQRLDALAAGLAPRDGVRLERLRLTAGFAAIPVTCGCKLVALDDGDALAIAVPAAELRRLRVAAPVATEAAVVDAPAESAPEAETEIRPEPAPAPPARPLVRFIWQSDAQGRLTSVSADIAALVGAEAAGELPGQSWAELARTALIDRDGGLAGRFAAGVTWSGHGVLWRGSSPDEGVRVELSGVPVLDAGRNLVGFRGFGLARMTEREPWPESEPADAPAPATENPPEPDSSEDMADAPLASAALAAAAEPAELARDDRARDTPAVDRPGDADAAHEETAFESADDATLSSPDPESPAGHPSLQAGATRSDASEDAQDDSGVSESVPESSPGPALPDTLAEDVAPRDEAYADHQPDSEEPRADIPQDDADAPSSTISADAAALEHDREDASENRPYVAQASDAAVAPAEPAAFQETAEPHENPTADAGGADDIPEAEVVAQDGSLADEPHADETEADDAEQADAAEAAAPGPAAPELAAIDAPIVKPQSETAVAEVAPEPVAATPAAISEPARQPDEPAAPPPVDNIVPLRNGHLTAVRPTLEPSRPNLSSSERNAFREIAKALGARIAGDPEPAPRLPPAGPLRLKPLDEARDPPATLAAVPTPALPLAPAPPAAEALAEAATSAADAGGETQARPRLPNSHADLLDKLPIAVLVNRGDAALYANRTFLDLLDFADLADLSAGGGVSRLIKEASRTDGGAMTLIDRLGHLVSVQALIASLSWLGEPATMMAFRHPDAQGGLVAVMTPEQAEEAELAAEFEAEEAESLARVEALRLDVDVREARIAELVAMLDTATDGVVTVDERGRMLSLNKTAEALFGYDQREVTGELFTLLFAAESHAPALDYLEGLKGGGVASVMNDGREIVGRVRQGGRIPLFMTMGQIAHGAERRFCAVLRDITAWKKTENDLVDARKAAEKASAQKSDVLAKISHEIRTPLNAIIGFAEVMAEERFGPIANERYKEYLRDIHNSGGYVISLVNDLLDLAKIEAGKLDLDFGSVNLNEIALSTVSLLQPEANRGRVVLRSGLSPKLPPVVADQRSIRQIVINLLSNAVKFTDAGGQVIVSTALGDQGEAILRVRDTGIGMDDAEIELALEPFRQVPTTRRKGGTGLGLPLTKALVEANRAAMTITSVKREGTLIEITFPPQRVLAG